MDETNEQEPQRFPPTRFIDALTKQVKTMVGYGLPGGLNKKYVVFLTGHNPSPAQVERAYQQAEKAYK